MNWSSWAEFFAMGGYGVYVWGSYAVTFACVIGEILLISKRRRTLVKRYGLIHDSVTEDTEKTSDTKEISDGQRDFK
ncbi:heme exporter protein D [Nitrosomonas aestuarii]|uniref:Heme exporter protein D n=1 Tax=Nitrosomonas aestuarii TaxID=52441 RepID=A0A1I4AC38_9PROT|nr:heme exporter protein CcmD [Nitrosomonas aestuarii]SFK53366.1 heme exporter protein D [Nitrosomonas aestuarii]